MYTDREISADLEHVEHEVPEKALISAIINHAIQCINRRCTDPYHVDQDLRWLFSGLSDPYFELLEMDPALARENLVKSAHANESFRLFRERYRRWSNCGTSMKKKNLKRLDDTQFVEFVRNLKACID